MNGILYPTWCTNECNPFVRTGFETYATASTSAIARTRDMIIAASFEDIPKKEDTIVLLNAVKLLKVESL